MYVLWVREFYGFHHDYALGIAAWLLVGGEDGFHLMPNPCGIIINVLLTATTTWAGYAATNRLIGFNTQPLLESETNNHAA